MCDRLGFEAGSNLCLNGGNMGHSSFPLSENGGWSKAMIMSLSLITGPESIDHPMDYSECWTPLDIMKIHRRFIPVVGGLCEGLIFHFWVSFEKLVQLMVGSKLLFRSHCSAPR